VDRERSFAAPPGPDWGWRIEITPDPGGLAAHVMFDLWPEGGREDLAAEAA